MSLKDQTKQNLIFKKPFDQGFREKFKKKMDIQKTKGIKKQKNNNESKESLIRANNTLKQKLNEANELLTSTIGQLDKETQRANDESNRANNANLLINKYLQVITEKNAVIQQQSEQINELQINQQGAVNKEQQTGEFYEEDQESGEEQEEEQVEHQQSGLTKKDSSSKKESFQVLIEYDSSNSDSFQNKQQRTANEDSITNE